jgi:hypothetical protein
MIRSRHPLAFNHLPTISSVTPNNFALGGTGYISAVSKKSIPVSTARSIIAKDSDSLDCNPKVIVPRQMSVTTNPLLPSLFRFIAPTFL